MPFPSQSGFLPREEVGWSLGPSLLLAQVLEFYTDHLAEYHKEFPKLRSVPRSGRRRHVVPVPHSFFEVLTIGGLSTGTQAMAIKKGCHMVVAPRLNCTATQLQELSNIPFREFQLSSEATPGRLNDLLSKKRMSLAQPGGPDRGQQHSPCRSFSRL